MQAGIDLRDINRLSTRLSLYARVVSQLCEKLTERYAADVLSTSDVPDCLENQACELSSSRGKMLTQHKHLAIERQLMKVRN